MYEMFPWLLTLTRRVECSFGKLLSLAEAFLFHKYYLVRKRKVLKLKQIEKITKSLKSLKREDVNREDIDLFVAIFWLHFVEIDRYQKIKPEESKLTRTFLSLILD